MMRMSPSPHNDFHAPHVALLLDSYARCVGVPLLPPGSAVEQARLLYESTMVVVSHGTEADPIFNYANVAAQRLFELHWDAFVRLPSRLSAGPVHRDERQRLLDRVARHGYIADYAGIRVASSGRQFRIEQATVWNLVAADGRPAGQAACFSRWTWLDQASRVAGTG